MVQRGVFLDAEHVSAAQIRRRCLRGRSDELSKCGEMSFRINPVELGQWITNEVADRQQLLQPSGWAIL